MSYNRFLSQEWHAHLRIILCVSNMCVFLCVVLCVVCVCVADFIRGMEVYGKTVLEVMGKKSQKLEWPGYSFYIEVPDGALFRGVTASVAVKVILQGQFKPAENSQLINPDCVQ